MRELFWRQLLSGMWCCAVQFKFIQVVPLYQTKRRRNHADGLSSHRTYFGNTCRFTVHRPRHGPFFGRRRAGGGGTWHGVGGVLLAVPETTELLTNNRRLHNYTHDWKREAFRVECMEWVPCASAARTSSNNSSGPKKSCACPSVAFLAGIISSPVASIRSSY